MSIKTWWKNRTEAIKLKKSTRSAVDALIENSSLDSKFIVMSILSGLVAASGVILADTSIIIAAMILAPLLNPLLALAAGVSLQHGGLFLYGLKAFFGGFIVVIFASTFFSMCLVILGVNIDVGYFLERFYAFNTQGVIFFVSLISGFAAVYSWLKNPNASNFVGVAIAVALVPFVALYGILFGTLQLVLIPFLSYVLFMNLLMIILGAVVAFLVMGINLTPKDVDKSLEESKEATE